MRKILVACLLVATLAISSCKAPVDDRKKVHEYKITSFTVKGYDQEIESDAEFLAFQPKLIKGLKKALLKTNSLPENADAREATLTIAIQDISLEMNAGRAFLVGDPYRVIGDVTLHDSYYNTLLGKAVVHTQRGDGHVITAVVGDAFMSEENHNKHLLKSFITDVVNARLDNESDKE